MPGPRTDDLQRPAADCGRIHAEVECPLTFRQPLPGRMYQTPGGTLGIGFPGAIGVKLAELTRTVVGFSGDGGALYTLQA